MEPVVLVLTTAGSEEQSLSIAEGLVERGLAACVNIIRRIRSIYRWKGEIWDDEEFLLVIKTRESYYEKVKDAIRELHSYELPEVLCIPVTQSEEQVQAWIVGATGGEVPKEEEDANDAP